MEDGQYSRAMRLLVSILRKKASVSMAEVEERANREAIPLEVVLDILGYLEVRKCISKAILPGGLHGYIVDDEKALELSSPGAKRQRGRLVLTLPAFNRYGIQHDLWALGMDFTPTEIAFRELISSASSEILICSPFAEFGGLSRFVEPLSERLLAGARLSLLSRQIAVGDPDSRYRQIRRFLDALITMDAPPTSVDVRNYHFSDLQRVESSTHAKFVVVDGRRAYIGSADFRSHSFDRNFEVGILANGVAAAELRRVFMAMFSEADVVAGGS